MRKEAAAFNREAKFAGSSIAPISKYDLGRQSIKAIVNFDGIKLLDIKTKHVGRSNAGIIEGTAPMLIVPSRCADMNPGAHLGGQGARRLEHTAARRWID